MEEFYNIKQQKDRRNCWNCGELVNIEDLTKNVRVEDIKLFGAR